MFAAVRAAAVEVNQDFTRFRAVARADDAAIFQFVHNARGAAVAEAQAALQQRDARLLFAADDFDALLDDFLVLVNAALIAKAGHRFGKLLVDFDFVTRLALFGDEINNQLNFLVRDERALCAYGLRRVDRKIEHVAAAEEALGAGHVEDRARVDL